MSLFARFQRVFVAFTVMFAVAATTTGVTNLSFVPEAQAFGFDSIKKAAKKVGHGIKKGAKATGRGVKKAAKATGRGVKKAAKRTEWWAKDTGKFYGDGIKKGAKAVGRGVKKAAKATGRGVKKVGRGAKKVAKCILRGGCATIGDRPRIPPMVKKKRVPMKAARR